MFPYLYVGVGFIASAYLFETYIDWRQYKRLLVEKCPQVLKDMKFDEAEFQKSRLYSLDKIKFSMAANAYNTLKAFAFLYFGLFSIFWGYSEKILAAQGNNNWVSVNEVTKSCVFIILLQFVSLFLELPTAVYSTFVLEQKHGFNKTTPKLFAIDMVKKSFLSLVFLVPLSGLFVVIVRWAAGVDYFIVYTYLFYALVTVFAIILFPLVIQPMFNKFTPLEDGELKDRIIALCKTVAFPVKKLFVVDGSKRSSHSNAYVFGFFKLERIVLFDTLMSSLDKDEIISVVGHELGHWKLGHVYRSLVISQLHTLMILYFSEKFLFAKNFYISFGFPLDTEGPIIVGLLLFQYIYIPVEQVLTFFLHVHSRQMEFEADQFSANLGYAQNLVTSLRKMALENKSDMNPDPWYSTFHYSHPPFLERITTLLKKAE